MPRRIALCCSPISSHADILQPFYYELRPFRRDRSRCRALPEGVTALGIEAHVDRNAHVIQCETIGDGMTDIVGGIVHGVDQQRRRGVRAYFDPRRKFESQLGATLIPKMSRVQ